MPFRKAQERNNELITTFSRMVSFAIKEGVEIILIAGDIFDADRITSRTADYFLDVVRRSRRSIFFYLEVIMMEAEGLCWAEDSSKSEILQRELTFYSFGDVVIAGVELNRTITA